MAQKTILRLESKPASLKTLILEKDWFMILMSMKRWSIEGREVNGISY